MPVVIDYEIIYDSNRGDLVAAVKEWMSRGWQPQGGVVADTIAFYQTLVKYETKRRNKGAAKST